MQFGEQVAGFDDQIGVPVLVVLSDRANGIEVTPLGLRVLGRAVRNLVRDAVELVDDLRALVQLGHHALFPVDESTCRLAELGALTSLGNLLPDVVDQRIGD